MQLNLEAKMEDSGENKCITDAIWKVYHTELPQRTEGRMHVSMSDWMDFIITRVEIECGREHKKEITERVLEMNATQAHFQRLRTGTREDRPQEQAEFIPRAVLLDQLGLGTARRPRSPVTQNVRRDVESRMDNVYDFSGDDFDDDLLTPPRPNAADAASPPYNYDPSGDDFDESLLTPPPGENDANMAIPLWNTQMSPNTNVNQYGYVF